MLEVLQVSVHRRRRQVHPRAQFRLRQARVLLDESEQLQVEGVQHGGHGCVLI
jgi:hypothetical protein